MQYTIAIVYRLSLKLQLLG